MARLEALVPLEVLLADVVDFWTDRELPKVIAELVVLRCVSVVTTVLKYLLWFPPWLPDNVSAAAGDPDAFLEPANRAARPPPTPARITNIHARAAQHNFLFILNVMKSFELLVILGAYMPGTPR